MKYTGIEEIVKESETANIAPYFAGLQINVDPRTGECWCDWEEVNHWRQYHDDHIINAGNIYGPTPAEEIIEMLDMAMALKRSIEDD